MREKGENTQERVILIVDRDSLKATSASCTEIGIQKTLKKLTRIFSVPNYYPVRAKETDP